MAREKNTGGNDIDIVALFCIIWKEKWLILQITTAFLAIGITYIFFSKPIYEVNAYITSPMPGDIASLNYGSLKDNNSPLKPYTTKTVYDLFINDLLSNSTKKLFFNSVYLTSLPAKESSHVSKDVLFRQFSKVLSIKEVPGVQPKKFLLSFRGRDPEQITHWASKYIHLANQQALNTIQADIKEQCLNIVKEYQGKINMKKNLFKEEKADRLVQLKEAISIASAAGIKELSNGTMIDASILLKPDLLYLRGTKTLQAELNLLNNRQSDDAFLNDLRVLENQIAFYKHYTINKDNVTLFRLDGEIEQPDSPRSPMKGFILVCSILLGLIFSILTVLTRRAFSKHL